jgi:hypothetical protein
MGAFVGGTPLTRGAERVFSDDVPSWVKFQRRVDAILLMSECMQRLQHRAGEPTHNLCLHNPGSAILASRGLNGQDVCEAGHNDLVLCVSRAWCSSQGPLLAKSNQCSWSCYTISHVESVLGGRSIRYLR